MVESNEVHLPKYSSSVHLLGIHTLLSISIFCYFILVLHYIYIYILEVYLFTILLCVKGKRSTFHFTVFITNYSAHYLNEKKLPQSSHFSLESSQCFYFLEKVKHACQRSENTSMFSAEFSENLIFGAAFGLVLKRAEISSLHAV